MNTEVQNGRGNVLVIFKQKKNQPIFCCNFYFLIGGNLLPYCPPLYSSDYNNKIIVENIITYNIIIY